MLIKDVLCQLKIFRNQNQDYYKIITRPVDETEEIIGKVNQFIFDININKEDVSDIIKFTYGQDNLVIDAKCSLLNKNRDLFDIENNSILIPVQLAYIKIINKNMYHFIPSSYFRNSYFSNSISLNKLQMNVLRLEGSNYFIDQDFSNDIIDLSIGQEYLFTIRFKY